MTYKIKVQDGNIIYAASDPSDGVTISIPESTYLILRPEGGMVIETMIEDSNVLINTFGINTGITLDVRGDDGSLTMRTAGDDSDVVLSTSGLGSDIIVETGHNDSSLMLRTGGTGSPVLIRANQDDIIFQTDFIDRLNITNLGEFKVQDNTGTAGQALLSQGPGLPPQWGDTSGGVAIPLHEITIGTGPGVNSFSTAQYNGDTKGLSINNDPGSFPVNSKAVTVDNPGDIFIYGANNTGDALNRSASLYFLAGVADNVLPTTTAGEVIIRSGRNQHGLSGQERGASEILLTNHAANNTNSTASSILMYAGGTTKGNVVLGPRNGGGVSIYAGQGRNFGGTFNISAGNAVGLSTSSQTAGDMYISAGNVTGSTGTGSVTGFAGSVYIVAGRNMAGTNHGTITFTTANIDRLNISDSGEFKVQNDAGTAGQALLSQGPGLPPQWGDVAAGSTGMRIVTSATDYTLQIEDAYDTLIRITKATTAVVTIPNDSTVNFPIGAGVLLSWNGTGPVSVGFEAGVTVDTPDTYNIGRRYGKITLMKTEANHWEIEGNLEPVI